MSRAGGRESGVGDSLMQTPDCKFADHDHPYFRTFDKVTTSKACKIKIFRLHRKDVPPEMQKGRRLIYSDEKGTFLRMNSFKLFSSN